MSLDFNREEAERFSHQRAILIQEKPWYGGLSLRFRHVIQTTDPTIKTAATDGTDLYYSPAYTATLTDPQLRTLIAHETGHPAFGHIWRAVSLSDHDIANQAADYILNGALLRDGFAPIPNWLYNADLSAPDKSFEQVYGILRANKRQDPDGDQPGQANGPQAPSDILPPQPATEPTTDTDTEDGDGQPQPSDQPATEADWQLAATQQEMVASKWGEGSPAASQQLDAIRKPQTDWRAILARFVETHAREDYSWATPNRRFLAGANLYLPGLRSENTPAIIVAIDTSGSVGQHTRTQFAAQLTAVVSDCQPEAVHVIYADDGVQHTDSFPAGTPLAIAPRGGGGTSFGPTLAHAAATFPEAACLIYLTDMDASDNDTIEPPPFPVLWAMAPHARRTAPFGEHIRLTED